MPETVAVDVRRSFFPAKEVKHFRIKMTFWSTLCVLFFLSIVGIPISVFMLVGINSMYHKHLHWLEDQGLTLDRWNRTVPKNA